MIRSSVVFPHPLGPRTTMVLPFGTRRFSFSMEKLAWRPPPPHPPRVQSLKVLETSIRSIRAIASLPQRSSWDAPAPPAAGGAGGRRAAGRCYHPDRQKGGIAMSEDTAVETQATELLRTLIRNGCVNTGEAASGHEERSVGALEDFFAGSGLSCERYTSEPGRMSLITRIEGRDPAAPTLLLMGHTDVVPVSPS